jgi:hypothetical protein
MDKSQDPKPDALGVWTLIALVIVRIINCYTGMRIKVQNTQTRINSVLSSSSSSSRRMGLAIDQNAIDEDDDNDCEVVTPHV